MNTIDESKLPKGASVKLLRVSKHELGVLLSSGEFELVIPWELCVSLGEALKTYHSLHLLQPKKVQ